ncbi:Endonuclease/Exonuclease/phosphatase family protein [Metarhizium rileyi]|uniref:Endonuclease/Exonuclease/phosphatase family protein n=1 Tax=Metarhizium rileyi (strain RCEF 4871) TaxID=1649241 RepID=A0A166ZEJ9_METRR|nr:Endonuclease/Exonuclease/phosphatase family protein [Metarhizium rileyi RCEF 4871]
MAESQKPQHQRQRHLRPQNQQVISPGSSLMMDIQTKHATMPVRLVSFNIRYAANKHERVLGEQPWAVRCPKMCSQLRFVTAGHESPFVCLQESLASQLNDIQEGLGKPWAHIGRGRGQGEADGEFSPIFYRSDTWVCEHNETRWLSKTPEKPSRGWDAALNRIVTIGLFSHRANGTKAVVMSTHFDHIGVEARKNSARLLIQFSNEWSHGKGVPPSIVLIGGDFNSQPDDEAYKMMTAPGSGMSDISSLVPEDKHYGNHLTYTSFGEPNEYPQRIDFLFVQEPRTAHVETFGVLSNIFDDQIRLSDHRAVVSDLQILI